MTESGLVYWIRKLVDTLTIIEVIIIIIINNIVLLQLPIYIFINILSPVLTPSAMDVTSTYHQQSRLRVVFDEKCRILGPTRVIYDRGRFVNEITSLIH